MPRAFTARTRAVNLLSSGELWGTLGLELSAVSKGPLLVKSQRYFAGWAGLTVADKVTATTSPFTQVCLTTKAFTVSACAAGVASALNIRPRPATATHLNNRFCFIVYFPDLFVSISKLFRNVSAGYATVSYRKVEKSNTVVTCQMQSYKT